MQIVIENIKPIQADRGIITIEEFHKRRRLRRWRVAKRMLNRFPLFAVEFMQDEFPNYNWDLFTADVTRKTRKGKSHRKVKSPLMKQGRYPLYRQAMTDYLDYGDEKRLEEAQYLRNRMFLPFRVVFQLKGEQRYWDFPSTATLAFIQDLAKIKFKSWDELQNIIDEKTRYGFGS